MKKMEDAQMEADNESQDDNENHPLAEVSDEAAAADNGERLLLQF